MQSESVDWVCARARRCIGAIGIPSELWMLHLQIREADRCLKASVRMIWLHCSGQRRRKPKMFQRLIRYRTKTERVSSSFSSTYKTVFSYLKDIFRPGKGILCQDESVLGDENSPTRGELCHSSFSPITYLSWYESFHTSFSSYNATLLDRQALIPLRSLLVRLIYIQRIHSTLRLDVIRFSFK